MKPNLSASILALLASTGIVKGQCALPTYVQMLANFNSDVGPLYCNLPSQSIQDFFEFAVGKAFAVDPPTYAFVGTCLPQVIASFQAFQLEVDPTCQLGQHLITPTFSATNGTDLYFGKWDPKFCFDFTTCNYANLDEYMASIAIKASDTFSPGILKFKDFGYNITGGSLATSQCWDSLKLSQTPGPNAFCSDPAPECDDISMVDVTIASKKPFSIPICNDGCRGVGNGGDLPEEKIINNLKLMADGHGSCGCDNPYCVSKDTVVTVERSGDETFEFASECTSKKAKKRAGQCKATKAPKEPKASKAPKATKAPKAPKAPKEPKASKATKAPKEPKASKATKA
jgi:hypothetical protein